MKPIWIVDDDESIRWVLEKALARENLATRSFSSARDALLALQTESPQVLVSDIRMPGSSGLELLQTVKAEYPGIPVIIITAFSDLDSAVSALIRRATHGPYAAPPNSTRVRPIAEIRLQSARRRIPLSSVFTTHELSVRFHRAPDAAMTVCRNRERDWDGLRHYSVNIADPSGSNPRPSLPRP